MKKNAVFSMLVTILAAFYSFAGPIVYDYVPTKEERVEPTYTRFPDFEIEVIKNGQIKSPHYKALIQTEILGDEVSIDHLDWLIIRALDFKLNEITMNYNLVLVPFSVDVRYQEKGGKGIVIQGTLNTEGVIQLILDEDSEVIRVEIVKYDDSLGRERMGRELGFIDQYNEFFLKAMVSPILMDYFTQGESLEALVRMTSETLDSKRMELR